MRSASRPRLWLSPLLVPLLAVPSGTSRPAVERIRSDVVRLAGPAWQGRRAGSEGADHAAAWIAAEFRKIGLQPAGEKGSYFQAFSFIDGVDLGRGNRLSTSPGSRRWKPGEDFRPLAFSAPGEVSGEVVFAGYGIVAKDLGHDDYAGADVKDRVVLVLRYGPGGDDPQSRWAPFTALRLKAATARDKGARALLVVTGPGTPGVPDELVPLRSDASLSAAGLPVLSVKRAVAEALFAGSGTTLEAAQKRLDEGHAASLALPVRADLAVDVRPRRSRTRNVLGLLPSPGPDTREVVVVGAHYDHLGRGMAGSLDPHPEGKIHAGADDNASGVAGLLELARLFEGRRASLRRSLLFVAFGAEEMGTLGSSFFVKSPTVPWPSIVGMVNMDMIGRLRDDALDVHGVGTSPVWRALLDGANRASGLTLKIREGGYGPSDHSPFYAAGKPVLFVFTGPHADYHRPTDTPDRINAAGIERVLGLVEGVMAGLAASTEAVPFVRVAAEKEQVSASRSFRVWVGGVPDYSEEGAGVAFSGVSPGSPAEKAGILAGDVLVRFGGKEIRNIYDYTYALGEYKPGDRVTAVVKREGREVTLEVTLGARPGAQR